LIGTIGGDVKMRSVISYILAALLFVGGIFAALRFGRDLPPPLRPAASTTVPALSSPAPPVRSAPFRQNSIVSGLAGNLHEPLGRLFLQLIVIVSLTRVVGLLFRKLGQPSVVGEMAAGIMLGPSLLGWLAPSIFTFVFPASSLDVLKLISQIGVCLFMFGVGMELDLEHLRRRAGTTVIISHVSILVPYLLGVLMSLALYSHYATAGARFVPFALFMGIATSITAFPVLARILSERGLSATPLGAAAIACAAMNDVAAWCILAVVVAITRSSGLEPVALNLGLVVLFGFVLLSVIRPRLPRWLNSGGFKDGALGQGSTAAVLILMLGSALATEVIGIHALFGAFLAGVIMPNDRGFRHYIAVRVESFSSIFLLPLFFAFTGLRMQLGLLNTGNIWLVCVGVIAIATLGKLGGTMLAAKLTGMSWNESFSLGALMNTRGLMELIALNIGYELDILSPQIFAIMVLMALVTTSMTGPLLTLSQRLQRRAIQPVAA
jgi:Kef-type K+ transport system membrane component KefB